MDEEKNSPARRVHIEVHKEAGSKSHGPHDALLLENEQRASAERRLVKKLDCRLLPTVVVIYIMNYIDVCRLLVGTALIFMLMNRSSDQL